MNPTRPIRFEKYLRENLEKGVTDHLIHAVLTDQDFVRFFVHPLNVDGNAPDFFVCDNDELLPGDQPEPRSNNQQPKP